MLQIKGRCDWSFTVQVVLPHLAPIWQGAVRGEGDYPASLLVMAFHGGRSV
jgi:hypothetical protein